MFCEHCGKQIPDGSRFCESCGAPVAARSGGQTPAYTQPTRPVQARPAQNAAAQPTKRKVRLGPILLVLAVVLLVKKTGWRITLPKRRKRDDVS